MDRQIPENEKVLAECEAAIVSAKERGASLSAAVSELDRQIDAMRMRLRFQDKNAAVDHRAALQKQLSNLKAALGPGRF